MDGKVRIWDREKNECYNELGSVGTSCVHALLVYDNILVTPTATAFTREVCTHSRMIALAHIAVCLSVSCSTRPTRIAAFEQW
jgi:hypothetical protein